MKRVMLDLETLSTKSNAAIISIGAIMFSGSRLETEESQRFYITIDPASSEKAGLHISASTFVWWMQQSDAARAQFAKKGAELPMALHMFSAWYQSVGGNELWGNGADFDNVVLLSSYEACNMPCPWKYYQNRCYRTLWNLMPEEIQRDLWERHAQGVAHNALDDAIRQAKIAREFLVDFYSVEP